MAVNIDKLKKHQKLISGAIPSGEPAIFDGYEIHYQLLTWAISNISTKELTRITKEINNG